ncbi:MAG: DUF502 domain-containing protein [Deltaproteobacteria bacterium]|nr:MAG: DUF502 domain-containing protein [Deltaproteobacteria bacterium]
MKRLRTSLKNYFLTGLLVILPIFITVKVILFLIRGMDAILKIIPAKYLPDTYLQVHIPGLGLIFVVILVLAVGLLTKNIVGRKIVRLGENIVERIPLVRILYAGVKQLLETIFLQKTDAFKRVGLVEYPRRGAYVIGFITGESKGEVQDRTDKNMINVFIPTTPNPTSGFYILIPEDEVVMLNMTVEDAFKLIISGGIVSPPK